jgi:hypothetical protein
MFMDIVTGPRLKQRYWCCERVSTHPDKKKRSLDLNFALPEEVKKWLKGEYKRRKKYNIRARKAGKQSYSAMLQRKKWPLLKPEAQKS